MADTAILGVGGTPTAALGTAALGTAALGREGIPMVATHTVGMALMASPPALPPEMR
jgi:hypothetical protein